MPRLQQAIKDMLPNSDLLCNLTADEVIAVGCSNQASVIGEPWDAACQYGHVSVPALSKSIIAKVSCSYQYIMFYISWVDLFCFQCGDEEESETVHVFTAQTPLSSRFSLPVPLGKKHNIAVVDVYEESEHLAKVFYQADNI